MQENITQTSDASNEHKHSEIERYLALNKWIISQKTQLLSISSVTSTN